MNVGIIAEDNSDVSVLMHITSKMIAPANVGFKKFIGNGCGKIRRKSQAWAEQLVRRGCSWIILAHDLDANDEAVLRENLEGSLSEVRARASVVLIPAREIESWLMYDSRALKLAFNGRKDPKLPNNPEQVMDPKKNLEILIRQNFQREYVNTVHNERIASHIRPSKLTKAKSFNRFPPFIERMRVDLGQRNSREMP